MPNAIQSSTTLTYIELVFIWVPLAICLLIGITMWFYNLDAKRAAMDVELERRRSLTNEKVINL